MTNYVLEITLQSPLTSAAGEGRVGLVDRDVAFDDLGLPILPGRRLKGLWREAYCDVAEAWELCDQSSTSVEQIFGESGQKPGDGDACMHVGNAEWQKASSLKPWLEYLQHPEKQKLHPDDVVQHFATVRTQTAIDRRTGAAKEDTLRLTRTLKAGWVFRAPVRFLVPPNQELINALALGATALQHMGTARTRGLGKVCCRLLALDSGGQSRDLTPVMNQTSLPSITGAYLTQPVQTPKKQATNVPCSNLGTPTHVLRYRFKLIAPAVIPVADGDPNTIMTRQDIPGSHLWGAAAWHYLHQANHTPADEAFRHAFLDGGLRFLTAYPEANNPKDSDEPMLRTIPIPHSVRKFKDSERLVDFVEQSPADPTKRLDLRYAVIRSSFLGTQAVETELNYHHTRAGDRRKGRALENDGNLFTYEAIQADQSFQGAVLGSAHDLKNLQTWLQELNTISIGRSRNAQYGKAEFKLDDAPQELRGLVEWNGFVEQQATGGSKDWSDSNLEEEWGEDEERSEDEGWDEEEWDGSAEHQTPEVPNLGQRLIITTLSPLLTVNNDGHPDARFPERELAKVLELNTYDLKLLHSYTRTEVIGGYNAHLRLPRQQWPAISAGSVFVFDTKTVQDRITDNHLLQLEHNGLGLRKGEGYGRIAVNRQDALDLMGKEETPFNDPGNPPDSKIPPEVEDLLLGIVHTRCLAEMQQLAITAADAAENIPSNSLLGRLRLLLQQTPAEAVTSLNNLRKPAKEGLMNCRIDTSEGSRSRLSEHPVETLYDLFKNAWSKPESLTMDLIKSHVEELVENRYSDTRTTLIDKIRQDNSAAMCKALLDYLLTALHRKSRRMAKPIQ